MYIVRDSLQDRVDLIICDSKRRETIIAYLNQQKMFGVAEHMREKEEEKYFMEQAKKMSREEKWYFAILLGFNFWFIVDQSRTCKGKILKTGKKIGKKEEHTSINNVF